MKLVPPEMMKKEPRILPLGYAQCQDDRPKGVAKDQFSGPSAGSGQAFDCGRRGGLRSG